MIISFIHLFENKEKIAVDFQSTEKTNRKE